jgi:hypothetical protein
VRRVVVSDRVFLILQALLPTARGGDRPARDDFVRLVVFPVRDYFAEHWDDPSSRLVSNPDHPSVRTLIGAGELVPMYEIIGRELADGTIELISVNLDFEGLIDPDEPVD